MKPVLTISPHHQKVVLFLLISLGIVGMGLHSITEPEFAFEPSHVKFGLMMAIPVFGYGAIVCLTSLIGYGPRTEIAGSGIVISSFLGLQRKSYNWQDIGEFHASTQLAGAFNSLRFVCAFSAQEARAMSATRPHETPTYRNAHVLIPLKLTVHGSSDEASEELARTLNDYREHFLAEQPCTDQHVNASSTADEVIQAVDKRARKRRFWYFLSMIGALAFIFIGTWLVSILY